MAGKNRRLAQAKPSPFRRPENVSMAVEELKCRCWFEQELKASNSVLLKRLLKGREGYCKIIQSSFLSSHLTVNFNRECVL